MADGSAYVQRGQRLGPMGDVQLRAAMLPSDQAEVTSYARALSVRSLRRYCQAWWRSSIGAPPVIGEPAARDAPFGLWCTARVGI
jgi:hypothetical protein